MSLMFRLALGRILCLADLQTQLSCTLIGRCRVALLRARDGRDEERKADQGGKRRPE